MRVTREGVPSLDWLPNILETAGVGARPIAQRGKSAVWRVPAVRLNWPACIASTSGCLSKTRKNRAGYLPVPGDFSGG